MDFDFTWVLLVLLFISGVALAIDRLWHRPKRMLMLEGYRKECESKQQEPDANVVERYELGPMVLEFPSSLFGVLIVVFVLRSFLVEPFTIPSSSMVPTLQVGDFVLVNKWTYGVRVPLVGARIVGDGTPERGDIMVFRNPTNPRINYIKRVIGVPGDEVAYQEKRLTINGQPVPQEIQKQLGAVSTYLETNGDAEYQVQLRGGRQAPPFSLTVEDGHYFVLGDNRDNSSDSRVWGLVPDDHIVGKAFAIWMHMPGWVPSFSRNRFFE